MGVLAGFCCFYAGCSVVRNRSTGLEFYSRALDGCLKYLLQPSGCLHGMLRVDPSAATRRPLPPLPLSPNAGGWRHGGGSKRDLRHVRVSVRFGKQTWFEERLGALMGQLGNTEVHVVRVVLKRARPDRARDMSGVSCTLYRGLAPSSGHLFTVWKLTVYARLICLGAQVCEPRCGQRSYTHTLTTAGAKGEFTSRRCSVTVVGGE